jgi:replicative DNA helicase
VTAPRVESGLDVSPPGAAVGAGASGRIGGATWLAERAVLVALLYRPDRVAVLEPWLRASDFADPQHAAVYATVAGLRAAGELRPINAGASLHDPAFRSAILDNVLAVQEALHAGRFTETPLPHVGVRDVIGSVPADNEYVRYGQMVLESSARRRLQEWAVYFNEPIRAPQYGSWHGAETREFATIHDGLVNDVADLQQRTEQSTRSQDLGAFAQLAEIDTPTPDTPLVVPATAPAHKLVERAERDMLTAVLTDTAGKHRRIRDRFEPGDFTASPRHAATWRAIQAVAHRGEPVNAITVAWEAERRPAEHGSALSAEELVELASAPALDSLRRQTTTVARASLYHRVQSAR